MKYFALAGFWLLAVGVGGCGESPPPTPVVNFGVVDTTLPPTSKPIKTP